MTWLKQEKHSHTEYENQTCIFIMLLLNRKSCLPVHTPVANMNMKYYCHKQRLTLRNQKEQFNTSTVQIWSSKINVTKVRSWWKKWILKRNTTADRLAEEEGPFFSLHLLSRTFSVNTSCCLIIELLYVTWWREMSHFSKNSIPIFLHHFLITSIFLVLIQTP